MGVHRSAPGSRSEIVASCCRIRWGRSDSTEFRIVLSQHLCQRGCRRSFPPHPAWARTFRLLRVAPRPASAQFVPVAVVSLQPGRWFLSPAREKKVDPMTLFHLFTNPLHQPYSLPTILPVCWFADQGGSPRNHGGTAPGPSQRVTITTLSLKLLAAALLELTHFSSENAYRCPSVRMYKVLSAITGVAPTRSPSPGFLATTSGFADPAFRTVTAPSAREVK